MSAVFNSNRKREASSVAQYLAAYYELSACSLDWVRTDHAQHIQVFSAGSIFSSSCFLTWPRGSTLHFMDIRYRLPPGPSLQEFLPWDQQPECAPLEMPKVDLTHPNPSVATEAVQQRTICDKPKGFTAYLLERVLHSGESCKGYEEMPMCI